MLTKTSANGIRQAGVQEVLRLYDSEYQDFNIKDDHEQLNMLLPTQLFCRQHDNT